MNITDPIIIPDQLWTKEQIFDQLGTEEFSANDISDDDAIWWVKLERKIAVDAIFEYNSEDYYVLKVEEINRNIIQRTKRALGIGE